MPATSARRIGEVIKRARVKRHLTADQVARGCNVSRSRVYQWESDNHIMPKNFPALSETLGISERRLKAVNAEKENT